MLLGERAGLAQEQRQRVGVADGIAGEQHHVPLDPVAGERAPVGAEEVLRVAAELEEGERVAAVLRGRARRRGCAVGGSTGGESGRKTR